MEYLIASSPQNFIGIVNANIIFTVVMGYCPKPVAGLVVVVLEQFCRVIDVILWFYDMFYFTKLTLVIGKINLHTANINIG
jgi:hypothetical protein